MKRLFLIALALVLLSGTAAAAAPNPAPETFAEAELTALMQIAPMATIEVLLDRDTIWFGDIDEVGVEKALSDGPGIYHNNRSQMLGIARGVWGTDWDEYNYGWGGTSSENAALFSVETNFDAVIELEFQPEADGAKWPTETDANDELYVETIFAVADRQNEEPYGFVRYRESHDGTGKAFGLADGVEDNFLIYQPFEQCTKSVYSVYMSVLLKKVTAVEAGDDYEAPIMVTVAQYEAAY